MSLDEAWEDVRQFHISFEHPVTTCPAMLSKRRAGIRYKWMLEEINEFMAADDICGQADAMIDLIYFALGTLVEMGVKPQALFNIVQSANMEKLWEDGKPRFNEDGKVVKPDKWQNPEPKIRSLIDKLKEQSF